MPGMPRAGRVTVKKAWVGGAPQICGGVLEVGVEMVHGRRHRPDHERQVDDAAGEAHGPEPAEPAQRAEDQHQADARDDQRHGERQQQVDLQARWRSGAGSGPAPARPACRPGSRASVQTSADLQRAPAAPPRNVAARRSSAAYQRRLKPCGGKATMLPAVNEAASTTSVGSARKTRSNSDDRQQQRAAGARASSPRPLACLDVAQRAEPERGQQHGRRRASRPASARRPARRRGRHRRAGRRRRRSALAMKSLPPPPMISGMAKSVSVSVNTTTAAATSPASPAAGRRGGRSARRPRPRLAEASSISSGHGGQRRCQHQHGERQHVLDQADQHARIGVEDARPSGRPRAARPALSRPCLPSTISQP